MRAEFDPSNRDVWYQILDVVHEAQSRRIKKTGSPPKYVTCSPDMYTLLQESQANGPYGSSNKLMGMGVRVSKKMKGCSLSVSTRKPPSEQARAYTKAKKRTMRQIIQMVKQTPFHQLINPPKIQPDGSWVADVSVQVPMPMKYITVDYSIPNTGIGV
jgi:hypothetical protein